MTRMPAVPARTTLVLQFPLHRFTYTGLYRSFILYVCECRVADTRREYDPEGLNRRSSRRGVIQCSSAVLLLVHGRCRHVSA